MVLSYLICLGKKAAPFKKKTQSSRHSQAPVYGGFYLYAIKKDGANLCATKKIVRTCVPST
jgi:hypothetical protein